MYNTYNKLCMYVSYFDSLAGKSHSLRLSALGSSPIATRQNSRSEVTQFTPLDGSCSFPIIFDKRQRRPLPKEDVRQGSPLSAYLVSTFSNFLQQGRSHKEAAAQCFANVRRLIVAITTNIVIHSIIQSINQSIN